jgi:hypothetical protein
MHPMRFGLPTAGLRGTENQTHFCLPRHPPNRYHPLDEKLCEPMDGCQRDLSRMRWVFRSKFKLCESK